MNKKILIATMAAVLCLRMTACGEKKEESSKAGVVSLNSTTTTASETATESTTAKKTTETKKETEKTTTETTTTTTTTTKATTTTTTTTKATTTKKTTTTTKPAATSALSAGSVKVTYNGCTFGVGDSFASVEGKLGSQPAPSQKLPSCISSTIVDEYYFYGMTIQVNNGKIFSIDMMDNGFYGNQAAATVKGVGCNQSTKSAVISAYGNPSKTDDLNMYYSSGSLSMQVTVFGDTVGRIWISDSSLG